MDQFWIAALTGAGSAAVINAAALFLKARIDRALEHRQWKRDRKQVAYVEIINRLDTAFDLIVRYHGEEIEQLDDMGTTAQDVVLNLLAPKAVRDKCRRAAEANIELRQAARMTGHDDFLELAHRQRDATKAAMETMREDLNSNQA